MQRYIVGGKENTKFIYDGNDVLVDDNGGTLTKYINGLGIDNKLKMVTNGTAKYFITDHLGSTVGLADSNGNLTEQTAYDSFGNATNNLSTRYQYTGREFDNFTGLHYYRARWYDGNLGRFISEDPIGLSGGINQFAYTHNNSVNRTDPSGLLDAGTTKKVVTTAVVVARIPVVGPIIVGGAIAIGAAYAIGEAVAESPYNPFVYGPLNPFGKPGPPPEKECKIQPQTQKIPVTTPTPDDSLHRGRIQIQGTTWEDSEPWAQKTPPTKVEGLLMLDKAWNRLPRSEQRERNQAYDDAKKYIIRCPPTGCLAPDSRKFQNRNRRDPRARIDIEIWTGSAFID